MLLKYGHLFLKLAAAGRTDLCACDASSKPAALNESKTAVELTDARGELVYKAKLKEDAIPEDPTSIHGNEDVPPFHGYSKGGTAVGQLVYAHVRLYICYQLKYDKIQLTMPTR